MEWYWWVLIAVAVIALGFVKIKVWNKMKENHKKKLKDQEEE